MAPGGSSRQLSRPKEKEVAPRERCHAPWNPLYPQARYAAALHACGLGADLSAWPRGDRTELGERGRASTSDQYSTLLLCSVTSPSVPSAQSSPTSVSLRGALVSDSQHISANWLELSSGNYHLAVCGSGMW